MFDFKLLADFLALTVLLKPAPRLLLQRDECSPPAKPGLSC